MKPWSRSHHRSFDVLSSRDKNIQHEDRNDIHLFFQVSFSDKDADRSIKH